MGETLKIRARNKEWLLRLLGGGFTLAELAALADMSEKQVRRGVADAAAYPEISESVRALASARGLAAAG